MRSAAVISAVTEPAHDEKIKGPTFVDGSFKTWHTATSLYWSGATAGRYEPPRLATQQPSELEVCGFDGVASKYRLDDSWKWKMNYYIF